MTMTSYPDRYGGKPTAEPITLKKTFGESPLPPELLPKATLQLASSLSNDDKEVLTYLIAYGRHVIHAMGAPSSVCKSSWKPWKSTSKVPRREQEFSSCLSSDSCTESFGLGEEASLKRSLWLFVHKASSTCDCFSCYASFWSRWSASPNRDHINEILDVIEEGPKSSKGKKKKRAEKKRAGLSHDTVVKKTWASGPNEEGVMQTSSNTSRPPDSTDKACSVMTSAMDATITVDIDEAPMMVTRILHTGRKKSMFRVMKKKEEACDSTLQSQDLWVNKVPGTTRINDGSLLVSGLVGEGVNEMEATVAIEIPGNFTTEASEVMAGGISPALPLAKNTPRLHRIAKRRQNQVIPLDCEGLSEVEREQETATRVESSQTSMAPRAADNVLGGRGFLARVFPDTLGRVASRLWDLVSVRLRSRTVEYH